LSLGGLSLLAGLACGIREPLSACVEQRGEACESDEGELCESLQPDHQNTC
jgi:hypothetical protein